MAWKDGAVTRVYALPGGEAAARVETGSKTATLQVGASALAVSADGRRVPTGNTDGEVTLWDAAGARLRQYDWKAGALIAAAFARDGLRAAVGGTDRQVVIWDPDD